MRYSVSRASRRRRNPATRTNVRPWPIFVPTRRHGYRRVKYTARGYSSGSTKMHFDNGKKGSVGTACRRETRKLVAGHKGWRNARHLDPNEGYPGVRYVLLHTVAHLLIRELALECGYNAASIRERIYADTQSEQPQAGILVYTAAADSDGTLGGLVDLGKPDSLGRLLGQALSPCRCLLVGPALLGARTGQGSLAARRVLPRLLLRVGNFVRTRKPLHRSRISCGNPGSRRRGVFRLR